MPYLQQAGRILLLFFVFALAASGVACAIAPKPASKNGPTLLPDIAALLATPTLSQPTSTGTPTWTPTELPAPTLTRPATRTPTLTPTLLLVPLAKLTLPPKPSVTPTATSTPGKLPPELKGKIAFKSDRLEYEAIFVMNPDGTDIRMLTDTWAFQYASTRDTFSMDHRYGAYVKAIDFPPANQIFYLDQQYNFEYQLTKVTKGGSAWDPAWAPAGDKIAFTSNYIQGDNIFVINRDGTGLARLTDIGWAWDHHPSWSPDGSQIIFSSNRTGVKQIWIMNADGKNPRNISPWADWNDWDPVWIKW